LMSSSRIHSRKLSTSFSSCDALILQGLPDLSGTKRGWCGSSRWRAGYAWDLWQNPHRKLPCAFVASLPG
jgi:hypothetical protein